MQKSGGTLQTSPSSSLERPGMLVRRLCSEIPPLGGLHLRCEEAGAFLAAGGTRLCPRAFTAGFFLSKTACFFWRACRGKRSGQEKRGLILSCLSCALKKREVGIFMNKMYFCKVQRVFFNCSAFNWISVGEVPESSPAAGCCSCTSERKIPRKPGKWTAALKI